MHTSIKNLFGLPALITGISLILIDWASAQPSSFTTLHEFTLSDGANPYAGVILSGNTLYGTVIYGGSDANFGAVFAVNTDGTGFTILHAFDGTDGIYPWSTLVLSGNTLYGTTSQEGLNYGGTVFAVQTNGMGFRTVYNLDVTEASASEAGLILSGSTLYGTTTQSDSVSIGTGSVFSVKTNGSDFTILHHFSPLSDVDQGTNIDGAFPLSALVLSGSNLFGTTSDGGIYNSHDNYGGGTVFTVTTNGACFRIVHYFTAGDDGSFPIGGLIVSGDTLFGTAFSGSTYGGTVFALGTNGTFTTLHSFNHFTGWYGAYQPTGTLVLSNQTLYGTTYEANFSDIEVIPGTVFALNTNGTGFTIMHRFADYNTDPDYTTEGYWPYAGLVLSSNVLYGTTWWGGTGSYGTVFDLPVPVTFVALGYETSDGANSGDGLDWTANSLSSSAPWSRVAYGDGTFVAVTWGDNAAAYSYDGKNWTASPGGLPSSEEWGCVAYGNSAFVATAWASDAVAYTTDGINWSSTTMPFSDNWYCLTYSASLGMFVAVASGDEAAGYSTDGITWTASTGVMPYSAAWQCVTHGIVGGVEECVAVAGASDKVAYSGDGIHWSAGTGLPSDNWSWLTYGNGIFVAIACYSDEMAYSTDGIHWTAGSMPFWDEWYMAAYANGVFVALSQADGEVAYSYDGMTWSSADELPFDDTWYALAAFP